MDALQILELFAFEALWVKRIVSACWTPKYKLWYVQRELNFFYFKSPSVCDTLTAAIEVTLKTTASKMHMKVFTSEI